MRNFQSIEWIAWNLMLAAIPVIIGYPLAAAIDYWTVKRKQAPMWIWILPALVWLGFLPNTSYLLTEWRHFLFDPHFVSIRDDVNDNPALMITVARQGLFFLLYSAAGALCFALAIRPMHHTMKKANLNLVLWSVPFFLLVSMGVYMGLMVRVNSWDLVLHPGRIIEIAVHAITTPLLLETIVVFAGLLWLLYIVVDMWVDGFMMRLGRGPKRASR